MTTHRDVDNRVAAEVIAYQEARISVLQAKVKADADLLEASKRALDHMLFRGWAIHQGHELREVFEQLKTAIQKAELIGEKK